MLIVTKKNWFWVVVLIWAIVGVGVVAGNVIDRFKVDDVELEILSPIAEPEPELTEIEKILADLNDVERQICETFPITECKIALAVQQSENGTQETERFYVEADGEISVGIFQIKQENWNTEACPYGLHALTDPENFGPNIECAYRLWDRCDGEEGNNAGCWHRWGTWHNGSAFSKL